ncbi:MAG: ferric reductase-like transmembrane domain-containing protein [Candidatus Daviesbacteria bacterium]|nr:MAG: ferric reductase-like transmembrane domain-containing protein [Candidatus Daviesbacteria bacterium]
MSNKFGQFSPGEMVETTGLLSIALLSLTLLIGPICQLFPRLDGLKAHRKFLGILSFLIALAHSALVYIFYVNFNLAKLFNPQSPQYVGLLLGLASLIILLVLTLTSNKFSLNFLTPKVWKLVQSTAYVALILAVGHFYLTKSTNGVFTVKSAAEQITFGLAAFVVLFRLLVIFYLKIKL